MASALAIVSKAVFEKIVKAKGSGELGDVLGIDRYTSTHASLQSLEEGGALFLVTVRPPDEALWLVAILENPTLEDDGWHADPSEHAITDVSAAKAKLVFASGTGITAKKGALAMSLQTPRVLTDDDAELLRGAKPKAKKTTGTKAAKTTKKPAAKPKSRAKQAAPKKKAAASSDEDDEGEPADDLLGPIEASLTCGDPVELLDVALITWRSARAPALAELVDTLGKIVTGPAITDESTWVQRAGGKSLFELGSLLAGVRELPASFLASAAEMLAEFADDPRIATAIGGWVLDPPTVSSSNYPFWTRSLELAVRIGDTRLIDVFAKRTRMKPPESEAAYKSARRLGKPSQFWGKFYAALDKARGKLAALTPPAVDVKAIAKLTKQASKLELLGALPTVAPPVRTPKAAAPAVAGTPLEQALAHAKAGRPGAAIDALLVAWRDVRAPELADLIDRATRLLPTYDRPFPVDQKAGHAAWLAAYADDPVAAMPQLVQHVNCGGAAAAERQVLSLSQLPDDPRIALRLAELAHAHQIRPQRAQYWKTFWGIVARTRDVRTIAPLRRNFRDFTGTYYDFHRQGKRIAGDFLLGDGAAPQLDAAQHALANQIAAALAGLEAAADRRERDLIDAIASEPGAVGPRLVYADWLSEREHPRGEAIVIACKDRLDSADVSRLNELAHGGYTSPTHVYGPISDLEFELDRGIPTVVKSDYRSCSITWRHLAGDPLLATVERIEMEHADEMGTPLPEDFARVVLDPTAKRLTTVLVAMTDARSYVATLEPLLARRWKRDDWKEKRVTLVRA